MKKNILTLIICLPFISGCAEQNNNTAIPKTAITISKDSSLYSNQQNSLLLDRVIRKYNIQTVVFGIYSLDKDFFKRIDPKINALKLGGFVNRPDTLKKIIQVYERDVLVKDALNQKRIIKKINEWSAFYFMFNSLVSIEYQHPVYTEEIIFELPETKHLFKNYLESPTQDWGSFDVAQISEINFDFIKYMVELDSKNRIKIVSKFVLFIQNKQKK